jgi:hypothetical protein
MSEDKGSKVSSKGGASIPQIQPLQNNITEKKGAPIPNMQPVTKDKTQSGNTPDNIGKTSGQTESGKSKQ